MPPTPALYWLPAPDGWRARLAEFRRKPTWEAAVQLANVRLDFLLTNALDQAVTEAFRDQPPTEISSVPVRLAILGSSTVKHLHAGVRMGGLRRGLFVTTYETGYGQHWQELEDTNSELYRFMPNAILFAFDAYHLSATVNASTTDGDAAVRTICHRIEQCWMLAKQAFHGIVLQQTPLPVLPPLMGSNEQRLPFSRARLIQRLNCALREMADRASVQLLSVDERAAQDGIRVWHDPMLWHNGKQEISPSIAPIYGDLAARLLAAAQGRSAKCLVLDLDNTIWGGVVGDDGLEGITLGPGSAQGEAFLSVQNYAMQLSQRGVILAVCSKNDEANAVEVFDKHPEMVLRRADIACFMASWDDKAANLRRIAAQLNIGLEALVFVDDNPFERSFVRRELPMVAVPEVPDEPALVAQCLADAGYFESLALTEEDRERARHYANNAATEALKDLATDLPSYLRSLQMSLVWRRFDRTGLQRIVQLIHKTNQFNLTTKRYTEAEVLGIMDDPRSFGLQMRLLDRFGDNGIIAIVIGVLRNDADVVIDIWLMSCRVLGRQVEEATLHLLARKGAELGAERLIGEYRPTQKNGIVSGHYAKLGFNHLSSESDGTTRWALPLSGFEPAEIDITVSEG